MARQLQVEMGVANDNNEQAQCHVLLSLETSTQARAILYFDPEQKPVPVFPAIISEGDKFISNPPYNRLRFVSFFKVLEIINVLGQAVTGRHRLESDSTPHMGWTTLPLSPTVPQFESLGRGFRFTHAAWLTSDPIGHTTWPPVVRTAKLK